PGGGAQAPRRRRLRHRPAGRRGRLRPERRRPRAARGVADRAELTRWGEGRRRGTPRPGEDSMRGWLLAISCLVLASCLPADGCGDGPTEASSAETPEPSARAARPRGARVRKPREGKWRPVEDIPGLSDDQRALAAQLQAIGYADGT